MGEQSVLARLAEAAMPLPSPQAPIEHGDGAPPGELASRFFPEIASWQPVLRALGIGERDAMRLAAGAELNGTSLQAELLASGLASEAELVRAVAARLGRPCLSEIDPDSLILRDEVVPGLLRARSGFKLAKIEERDGRVTFLLSPEGQSLAALERALRRYPPAAGRTKIVAPQALRRAFLKRARPLLAREARDGLFERYPAFSARTIVTAWQGCLLGILLVMLPLALVLWPAPACFASHVAFTLFFFSCVWLRFAAIRAPVRSLPPQPFDPQQEPPFYSVLVALRQEAGIVPQLLDALEALEWPRSRLEVKLVCEADDAETLGAIRRCVLPHHVEIVEVPAGEPRTKPKALAYALQTIRGDYVVLYDAEDRPHPRQLLEAWGRFAASPRDLACLQAPLEIANGDASRIARMFAFEYRALFRGMLPWLASRQLVLPLGGTSNHFRVSSLDEVGGWDPYNVTEDADLAVRLARFGYRTETLALPTYEDAPETLGIWLPQRTRWFKGWLQTWLVHSRDPVTLCGELGLRSFAVAQILSAGLVLSALVHPLLVGTILYLAACLALGRPFGLWQSGLLGLDLANIACGYVSYLLLGWRPLDRGERKGFWRIVLWTPLYWLLLSAAAWRAVLQLCRQPHLWEKTPHAAARDGPRSAAAGGL